MFNKFELIGIAGSIMCMVVILWLIRVESVEQNLTALNNTVEEVGDVVFVAAGDNQSAAVADALVSASDNGQLEKLVISDVVYGSGDEVAEGDMVTVHYTGTLQNGQQFDSSYAKETPFTFEVGAGRVIEGWDKGLLGMKVGGKRILVVPPELGYGASGGGPIPPNTTLVFTVELLEIK